MGNDRPIASDVRRRTEDVRQTVGRSGPVGGGNTTVVMPLTMITADGGIFPTRRHADDADPTGAHVVRLSCLRVITRTDCRVMIIIDQ